MMNIDDLTTKFDRNEPIKWLFFWGHRPNADGSIGKTCLSQWFESGFKIDGIYYRTAEHYMMAQKARLFNDREMCDRIIATDHPRDAQKLGRKVANFQNSVWEDHRFQFVVDGNLAKFEQNHSLRSYLLGTKDQIIVEASPNDRIWGVGLPADSPYINNPHEWLGTNLLGFALMEVRAKLSARNSD